MSIYFSNTGEKSVEQYSSAGNAGPRKMARRGGDHTVFTAWTSFAAQTPCRADEGRSLNGHGATLTTMSLTE
jgi:hypothetical protein